MSFELVEAEKANFPVAALCRALSISRAGLYSRRARAASTTELRAARVDVDVAAVFVKKRGRYGAPRVAEELRRHGRTISRKLVACSMRRQRLVARPKRRFVTTTDSTHGRPAPPNLVRRSFRCEAPNRIWVADTTYLPTKTGFVFLVVVLDLFARSVVGWSVGDALDAELAATALRRAVEARRPPEGLVVHTDRGGEFVSSAWRRVVEDAGARASASATGNCFDNAVAESFFSTLEFEGPNPRLWRGAADAELALPAFLDEWYNIERLHSFNAYRSPAEAESRYWLRSLAA